MKKIATSLLLLILTTTFLYNAVGFHLLFSLNKEQAWVNAIEKKQNLNFKVLKLNATLYSFMEDTDLEYVNENITINKQVYHVFKKKIKDNIISLYYLPNKQQTSSDISLKKIVDNELFDNTPIGKKPLEKLFKSFIKDYVPNSLHGTDYYSNEIINNITLTSHPNGILHSGYLSLVYSPPKLG